MDRLKQLESFVAIATRGSLTAAAKAEGVAPAIMGRRLDALEERLGVKLLLRTTRRITLTHEGSAFLEDCQRLLVELANAEASVSAGGVKASGHLRVTAPAGFGRRHVAPLVPRFHELHPEVTISLNLSDRAGRHGGRELRLRGARRRPARLLAGQPAPGRQPAPLRRHARVRAPPRRAAPSGRAGALRLPEPVERRLADPRLGLSRAGRGRRARGDPPQADRPARLLRRPGAARLVPGRPRHRLAQHLGGGGRDRRRPAGAAARRVRRAAQRHLRGVPAAQAPAAAGAAVARFPEGAIRAAGVLGRHNRCAVETKENPR